MSKIWKDGQFIESTDATVSVFDHGLLYGDGCFEGIRIYNGRILKLRSHIVRMFESASAIRLQPGYSIDEIEEKVRETVKINNQKDGYIRLVFTRGKGTLGLNPFLCPEATVFVIVESIKLYPEEMYEDGMSIIVAKRPRVPAECLDPKVKSLNYLNNILAKIEAIDAGVLEALMLNIDGEVAECTGDNIFIIKDGVISTPPTSSGILHGITRRLVMEDIAPAIGLTVQERTIKLDEVLGADEVFLTGTAAEIIGVSHIDDIVIGAGKVGKITHALEDQFRKMVSENAPED
ncbi:MAG TPA: branched-chain-amino-acid transaminase [Phycisphaerales bacterium]|nr:branched-chain-amino-acid transaminase [Phycisphaerales bacterium]HIB50346.1 branched-chain-amino-acid transaminase [Phycisphaerales bacterium]HIN84215.1 branched-chain-amino-acid transaminase [Phycisphaerales bacterium]HIO19636.1 branched-chain-amino-acid transaminase [Phycisphaerales bacterium]HIO52903.1 branched-chain-amino-acid transaminase [Phycisphaerales bacterium]